LAKQIFLHVVPQADASGPSAIDVGTKWKMDSYFRLSNMIQCSGSIPGTREWFKTASNVPNLSACALNMCAIVLKHWAAPSNGNKYSFQWTEMVEDVIKAFVRSAGIPVEVMDAWVTVLGSALDESMYVLFARDITGYISVVDEIWTNISTQIDKFCRDSGPIVEAEELTRTILNIFQAACSKNMRAIASIAKLTHVISKKRTNLVLLPLIIADPPVRGAPGMGHWVSIEYTLEYGSKGRGAVEPVKGVILRAGDSLQRSRNNPFQHMNEKYVF
jgi:hypothetical protein